METSEERIWILLSRKFSDSITENEEIELKQLLRYHPDAQYTFEILGKIWHPSANESSIHKSVSFHDMDMDKPAVALLENTEEKRTESVLTWRRKRVLYYAASIILLLGASIYFWYAMTGGEKADVSDFYTVSTNPGEIKKMFLPDGTEIWLNADSHIEYPVNLASDSIRIVMLTGEAYFKVKHDEQHPFIIRTKNMEIKDIGTEFNVKSYPDESQAEATLISGLIEINLPDNKRSILLKPNEKIVVYQNRRVEKYGLKDSMKQEAPVQDIQISGYQIAPIKKDPIIQTFSETAWMQNDLVFKNEPFEELAKAMERKYAVKIIIKDNIISQYQLTGIFRDENIEQALMELQVIAPFNYNIKDSVVTIFNK